MRVALLRPGFKTRVEFHRFEGSLLDLLFCGRLHRHGLSDRQCHRSGGDPEPLRPILKEQIQWKSIEGYRRRRLLAPVLGGEFQTPVCKSISTAVIRLVGLSIRAPLGEVSKGTNSMAEHSLPVRLLPKVF